MSAATGLFGPTEQVRNGMGGHQSARAEKEVWLTPPDIIRRLGSFDLDPCACPEPRPWPTAKQHYTRTENGLLREWTGRCWVNPPYTASEVGFWLGRLAHHGNGTALIFARTETESFHQHVWGRATAILFLRGRLFFHHQDGARAAHNAGAPSCLVAYGIDDATAMKRSGIDGKVINLR